MTTLAQGLRRLRVAEEHDHGPSGLYGAPKERFRVAEERDHGPSGLYGAPKERA